MRVKAKRETTGAEPEPKKLKPRITEAEGGHSRKWKHRNQSQTGTMGYDVLCTASRAVGVG